MEPPSRSQPEPGLAGGRPGKGTQRQILLRSSPRCFPGQSPGAGPRPSSPACDGTSAMSEHLLCAGHASKCFRGLISSHSATCRKLSPSVPLDTGTWRLLEKHLAQVLRGSVSAVWARSPLSHLHGRLNVCGVLLDRWLRCLGSEREWVQSSRLLIAAVGGHVGVKGPP